MARGPTGMMCSTGVVFYAFPLFSLLSQKHKTVFFCPRDGGWGSLVPLLDPDTNLEDLEPQRPKVWELLSRQGTRSTNANRQPCFGRVSLSGARTRKLREVCTGLNLDKRILYCNFNVNRGPPNV